MRNRSVWIGIVAATVVMPVYGQTGDQQGSNQQVVQGGGTTNYITKFTGTHRIGNSALFENGPNLITFDNFAAANVTATVNGPLSVAMTAVNNTTDGSTDQDAPFSSGLRAILATSASPAAMSIAGINTSTVGDPVGVYGETTSTGRGIGGRFASLATSGNGVGVVGNSNSPDGFGVLGLNSVPTGNGIGIFGYTISQDGGIGIQGRALNHYGFSVGVNGETFSPDGFAGSFVNYAGGNVLRGVNNTQVVFRVDGNGTVFANGGLQPGGADFAESMAVRGDRSGYGPGDLLVIDVKGERRLALSQEPYSTLVAGIYSTKPGMLGSTRKADEAGAQDEIPLAVVGIVPCKVTAENGPIHRGDLLVTSTIPGHAMKGTERNRMLGAVVGKALEPLQHGTGVIQVLVTLQ